MTSFEDAARKMLGAPPEAIVSSDWERVGYNTGCDTCGYGGDDDKIVVSAHLYYRTPAGRLNPNKNQSWRREFTDLPALWSALFSDETDTP